MAYYTNYSRMMLSVDITPTVNSNYGIPQVPTQCVRKMQLYCM